MTNTLVVGAALDSLGSAIVSVAEAEGHAVTTAGISGEELYVNALHDDDRWRDIFQAFTFDNVICTVGINEPASDEGSLNHTTFPEWLNRSFNVNVVGPMNILRHYLDSLRNKDIEDGAFVGISSNSAKIARTNSMAYCASKAALSMALRVAAREVKGHPATIYGYELGLLQGTPMTRQTEERFGPSQTRMPGAVNGLHPRTVAAQIVATLGVGGAALNGVLLRLDAGEQ